MMREQNMDRINVEEVKSEMEQMKSFKNAEIEPRMSITVTCTELLSFICG